MPLVQKPRRRIPLITHTNTSVANASIHISKKQGVFHHLARTGNIRPMHHVFPTLVESGRKQLPRSFEKVAELTNQDTGRKRYLYQKRTSKK